MDDQRHVFVVCYNSVREDFKIKTRNFPSTNQVLIFLAASLLVALALLALPTPRAHAQTSGQGNVQGQIVNGTKDAKPSSTAGLTVTLYVADMNAQSTITKTAQADTNGRFAFSNIQFISTTRMLATANYLGIDYASDILAFDGITTTVPASVTVYETTTDPSVVQVAQTHFVVDVQTGLLNVLEVVQVTNGSDRAFVGTDAIGPHRITLPMPILAGATDIQFESQDADATTIRGTRVLSYTLPFQPGNESSRSPRFTLFSKSLRPSA